MKTEKTSKKKKFSYMKKKEIRRRLQKAADHLRSLIDEKRAFKAFGSNEPVFAAIDEVTKLQDLFDMPRAAEGPSKNKGIPAPQRDKGKKQEDKPAKKSHRISPEGLKRIRDAQKRRWAAQRLKTAAAAAPPKKKAA